MARGWESKSIEQQQEETLSPPKPKRPLTPDQIREEQERRGLELSRQRILEQLKMASHPRHRAMLEAALADLNGRLQATKRQA